MYPSYLNNILKELCGYQPFKGITFFITEYQKEGFVSKSARFKLGYIHKLFCMVVYLPNIIPVMIVFELIFKKKKKKKKNEQNNFDRNSYRLTLIKLSLVLILVNNSSSIIYLELWFQYVNYENRLFSKDQVANLTFKSSPTRFYEISEKFNSIRNTFFFSLN